jgi:peptide/nickel transport system substrate-binding protein
MLALVALSLAVLAAGCGGSSSKTAAGNAPGGGSTSRTFTMAMPSVPSTLDNEFVIHPMVISYQPLVYDSLRGYATKKSKFGNFDEADIFTPKFAGLLAQSTAVDSTKTKYTFKLRANAKSFYGNTLSADDVIWAFKRKLALNANSGLNMQVGGIKDIAQVKKIDALTVEISTAGYHPLFEHFTTLFFANSIWDSTEVKKHTTAKDPWAKEWLSRNDAGYGAYHVTSYRPGSEMILEANPGYWGPKPYFNRIVWKEVPSAANRLALLAGKSVDYAYGLTSKARSQLRADKKVAVLDHPSNAFIEIGLNNKLAPFTNKDFRLALAYAFPYQQVLDSVYYGEATPRRSIVPSTYPGYTDKYWAAKTDVARAAQLLKSSGVDPSSTTINIAIDSTNGDAEQVALLARTAWGKLGIKTNVDKQAPATYSDRLGKRQDQAYIFGDQAIYPDAGFATWLWFHTKNFPAWSNYNNPTLEKLFTTADAKKDPAARMADYDTVQKILMQDMPVISVAQPGFHVTMDPTVKGYAWFPDNALRVQSLSR